MARKVSAEESERREAHIDQADASIANELMLLGVHVESVWDLPRDKTVPSAAFDLMFRALEQTPRHPRVIRLGLANALANRAASDHLEHVLDLLRRENDVLVRDALAGAASEMASPDQADRLLEACRDKSLGDCRVMFVPRLARFRRRGIREALQGLANDPILKDAIARHVRADD
ncbi:hypothetical protein GCM10009740_22890 [Terrabacter terrae]|uniref:HEAT repeat domain-containing protein n=1 Tax=Terrabacter terrae TaxID=318434 RepID=A0ABN2UBM0_9MICO